MTNNTIIFNCIIYYLGYCIGDLIQCLLKNKPLEPFYDRSLRNAISIGGLTVMLCIVNKI
jgi:hypothetical protein